MKLDHVPVLDEASLEYEREENGGHHTVITGTTMLLTGASEMLVNSTAWDILRRCDGSTTVDGIHTLYCARFPDVSAQTLHEDILGALSHLWHIGLIKWKDGRNPFMDGNRVAVGGGVEVWAASEDQLRLISAGIDLGRSGEAEICYFSPLLREDAYDDVSIRLKLFTFSEEFFLLMRDGELSGIASVGTPDGRTESKAAEVNVVICRRASDLGALLAHTTDLAPVFSAEESTKLRYVASGIEPRDVLTMAMLERGFAIENRLPHELGLKQHVTTYFLPIDHKRVAAARQQRAAAWSGRQ